MNKDEIYARVEAAKDQTPGTGWFVSLIAFSVIAVFLWSKLVGAGA